MRVNFSVFNKRKNMAGVCLLVLVLVAVQEALGNECVTENLMTCDECIRCGGNWCNKPRVERHCSFTLPDNWCPNDQETLVNYQTRNVIQPGSLVNPTYAERTLYIDVSNTIEINYGEKKLTPLITIVNTTQNNKIDFDDSIVTCTDIIECTTTITATARTDFCSSTSGIEEYVHVKVEFEGLNSSVLIRYHVPCACYCSQKVERNSKRCNGHGDFSCGICKCDSQWSGVDCSIPNCHSRGDIQCTSNINGLECSGNGYCGPCDSCICYTDREGSQYFDRDYACMDLCMEVEQCEDCLTNTTGGQCNSCDLNNMRNMTFEPFVSTKLQEIDEIDRRVWVICNQTNNDCYINYAAKKDDDGNIVVMIINSCNDVIYAERTATPKVPIILAVVGILATVAAVAGVMIWKHMNAIPEVPLNNPGYGYIDAEDCTGENPLYKPPTSSFKNPMYGNKW